MNKVNDVVAKWAMANGMNLSEIRCSLTHKRGKLNRHLTLGISLNLPAFVNKSGEA